MNPMRSVWRWLRAPTSYPVTNGLMVLDTIAIGVATCLGTLQLVEWFAG